MTAAILAVVAALAWTSGAEAARGAPAIADISRDVVTDIGGNVELHCTISNGKEYPILWMRIDRKGTGFPISTGPHLLAKDNRIKLNHDAASGNYSLQIRDVRPTDAATYQCQVVVSLNNMLTADVKLQVKMPPAMDDTVSRNFRAVAGESAELSCPASGFPEPQITWSREDGGVLPTGSDEINQTKLAIQKTMKEDRGNYICRAENGVGKSQQRVATLEVEFPPSIEVPRPRLPQATGYDAQLKCTILAFPPPSIYWKFGDKVLSNTDNYQISHFASQDETTSSTLTISGVQPDQFGKYSCEASNRHGSASQHLELYSSEMPICPPVCGDVNLNNAPRFGLNAFTIISSLLTVKTCAYL